LTPAQHVLLLWHLVVYPIKGCILTVLCLVYGGADQVTRKVAEKGSMGFFGEVRYCYGTHVNAISWPTAPPQSPCHAPFEQQSHASLCEGWLKNVAAVAPFSCTLLCCGVLREECAA
jgi:hypothetical protein